MRDIKCLGKQVSNSRSYNNRLTKQERHNTYKHETKKPYTTRRLNTATLRAEEVRRWPERSGPTSQRESAYSKHLEPKHTTSCSRNIASGRNTFGSRHYFNKQNLLVLAGIFSVFIVPCMATDDRRSNGKSTTNLAPNPGESAYFDKGDINLRTTHKTTTSSKQVKNTQINAIGRQKAQSTNSKGSSAKVARYEKWRTSISQDYQPMHEHFIATNQYANLRSILHSGAPMPPIDPEDDHVSTLRYKIVLQTIENEDVKAFSILLEHIPFGRIKIERRIINSIKNPKLKKLLETYYDLQQINYNIGKAIQEKNYEVLDGLVLFIPSILRNDNKLDSYDYDEVKTWTVEICSQILTDAKEYLAFGSQQAKIILKIRNGSTHFLDVLDISDNPVFAFRASTILFGLDKLSEAKYIMHKLSEVNVYTLRNIISIYVTNQDPMKLAKKIKTNSENNFNQVLKVVRESIKARGDEPPVTSLLTAKYMSVQVQERIKAIIQNMNFTGNKKTSCSTSMGHEHYINDLLYNFFKNNATTIMFNWFIGYMVSILFTLNGVEFVNKKELNRLTSRIHELSDEQIEQLKLLANDSSQAYMPNLFRIYMIVVVSAVLFNDPVHSITEFDIPLIPIICAYIGARYGIQATEDTRNSYDSYGLWQFNCSLIDKKYNAHSYKLLKFNLNKWEIGLALFDGNNFNYERDLHNKKKVLQEIIIELGRLVKKHPGILKLIDCSMLDDYKKAGEVLTAGNMFVKGFPENILIEQREMLSDYLVSLRDYIANILVRPSALLCDLEKLYGTWSMKGVLLLTLDDHYNLIQRFNKYLDVRAISPDNLLEKLLGPLSMQVEVIERQMQYLNENRDNALDEMRKATEEQKAQCKRLEGYNATVEILTGLRSRFIKARNELETNKSSLVPLAKCLGLEFDKNPVEKGKLFDEKQSAAKLISSIDKSLDKVCEQNNKIEGLVAKFPAASSYDELIEKYDEKSLQQEIKKLQKIIDKLDEHNRVAVAKLEKLNNETFFVRIFSKWKSQSDVIAKPPLNNNSYKNAAEQNDRDLNDNLDESNESPVKRLLNVVDDDDDDMDDESQSDNDDTKSDDDGSDNDREFKSEPTAPDIPLDAVPDRIIVKNKSDEEVSTKTNHKSKHTDVFDETLINMIQKAIHASQSITTVAKSLCKALPNQPSPQLHQTKVVSITGARIATMPHLRVHIDAISFQAIQLLETLIYINNKLEYNSPFDIKPLKAIRDALRHHYTYWLDYAVYDDDFIPFINFAKSLKVSIADPLHKLQEQLKNNKDVKITLKCDAVDKFNQAIHDSTSTLTHAAAQLTLIQMNRQLLEKNFEYLEEYKKHQPTEREELLRYNNAKLHCIARIGQLINTIIKDKSSKFQFTGEFVNALEPTAKIIFHDKRRYSDNPYLNALTAEMQQRKERNKNKHTPYLQYCSGRDFANICVEVSRAAGHAIFDNANLTDLKQTANTSQLISTTRDILRELLIDDNFNKLKEYARELYEEMQSPQMQTEPRQDSTGCVRLIPHVPN